MESQLLSILRPAAFKKVKSFKYRDIVQWATRMEAIWMCWQAVVSQYLWNTRDGVRRMLSAGRCRKNGRKAVEMNRHDPWAHHAVDHVFEKGRLDEGIAWMESLSGVWERSTLYTHNWWHVVLYYLDKEDYRKVLELYNTRI